MRVNNMRDRAEELRSMDKESLVKFSLMMDKRLDEWESKWGMCNAGSLNKPLTGFQEWVLNIIGLPIIWDDKKNE